jgi:hypothetical protein
MQLKDVLPRRRIDEKVELDVPIGLDLARSKTSPLGTTGSTFRLRRYGLAKLAEASYWCHGGWSAFELNASHHSEQRDVDIRRLMQRQPLAITRRK